MISSLLFKRLPKQEKIITARGIVSGFILSSTTNEANLEHAIKEKSSNVEELKVYSELYSKINKSANITTDEVTEINNDEVVATAETILIETENLMNFAKADETSFPIFHDQPVANMSDEEKHNALVNINFVQMTNAHIDNDLDVLYAISGL